MGLIRGGLFTIVVVVLFFSLLVGNVLLFCSMSLDYDNLKDSLVPVVRELVSEEIGGFEEGSEDFVHLQQVCETDSEVHIDDVDVGDLTAPPVPCSVVAEGPDAILGFFVEEMVDDVYNKKYECSFFDCPSENGIPLFLISKHTKDYCQSKFFYALVLSLILISGIFFLVVNKFNWPIVVGAVLIFAALPLLLINFIASLFVEDFNTFSALFSGAGRIFLISSIVGIVLIGAGIGLRIWSPDFLKRKFSKKEVKGIVKKEIKQGKIQELKNRIAKNKKVLGKK